jgi:hypothetical protein
VTDDNLPDYVWITGRYVCYEGDMYQTGKGLEPVSEKNGHTKYHHTRQYTGLEREIERLHQALSHSNDVLRYYETKDGGHEAYCQRVENEAALKEADIARQALKETT